MSTSTTSSETSQVPILLSPSQVLTNTQTLLTPSQVLTNKDTILKKKVTLKSTEGDSDLKNFRRINELENSGDVDASKHNELVKELKGLYQKYTQSELRVSL